MSTALPLSPADDDFDGEATTKAVTDNDAAASHPYYDNWAGDPDYDWSNLGPTYHWPAHWTTVPAAASATVRRDPLIS